MPLPLTLRGILLLRLIFGLYYKCSNSITVSVLLKLYCISYCVFYYTNLYLFGIFTTDISLIFVVLFDLITALEITVNIYISLVAEEEDVLKYFSCCSKKFHFWITYIIITNTLLLNLVSFIIYTKYLDVVTNFWCAYQMIAASFGWLTTVCIAEHHHKTVKDLCKELEHKFEDVYLSDAAKHRHVQDFIIDYMKMVQNLDGTMVSMRKKVLRYLPEYS